MKILIVFFGLLFCVSNSFGQDIAQYFEYNYGHQSPYSVHYTYDANTETFVATDTIKTLTEIIASEKYILFQSYGPNRRDKYVITDSDFSEGVKTYSCRLNDQNYTLTLVADRTVLLVERTNSKKEYFLKSLESPDYSNW